ncbi:MAG: hypothetical protein ABIS59_02940 [Candidatus Saccharibacteria bacterium]
MDKIAEAIKNHRYLEFNYEGHVRRVVPYAFGRSVSKGTNVMRALQLSGGSVSGKNDFPKLFAIDEISELRILDDIFSLIPLGYKKGDKHINPILGEL